MKTEFHAGPEGVSDLQRKYSVRLAHYADACMQNMKTAMDGISEITLDEDGVFLAPVVVLMAVEVDKAEGAGRLIASTVAVPIGVPPEDLRMVLRNHAENVPDFDQEEGTNRVIDADNTRGH